MIEMLNVDSRRKTSMKLRSIFSTILVCCLCLVLSGCKATQKDLEKEIEKMKEIREAGVLLNGDYKLSMTSMVSADGSGELEEVNLTFKKAGKNMYMYLGLEGGYFNFYIGEEDGKYYVFSDSTIEKTYEIISEGEYDSLKNKWESQSNGFEESYASIAKEIEENRQMCENEGVTCSITKKIFAKELTFKMIKEDNADPKTFEITLKEGKILSVFRKQKNVEGVITFDYDEQKIILPSINGFVYDEGLSETF